jgi:RimJ/RimL family protein N-acetyltransferase
MSEGAGTGRARVRLAPWERGDQDLLQRLVGNPAMMEHLGGPETPEQVAARHERYLRAPSGIFKALDAETGEPVGSVVFWSREWAGEEVYEIGWAVLPEHQGRGIASAATALAIGAAQAEGLHRHLHAFPNVANAASNSLCRRLGFALLGPVEFEYPKGSLMRCNDWRLDLAAPPDATGGVA